MLEFARHNWLWLFALVAAFYVAWWFARRYRKQRVTYGRIWQRVAKRVLPPAGKRILRTVLTLLIAGVMLSSVVLYAAGLQRPVDEAVPPTMLVVFLDNSPSMRAQTRAQEAQARAQQLVDALGADDRAVLAWSAGGICVAGAWLKRGDNVGVPPPTDFRHCGHEAVRRVVQSLRAPPDVPTVPAPRFVTLLLTDQGTDVEGMHVETFGQTADNNYVRNVEYAPPVPGAGHNGVLSVEANGLWRARLEPDGPVLPIQDGGVALPIQNGPLEMRISVAEDALQFDNSVGMSLSPSRLARVTVCYPSEDGEPNPLLVQTLAQFLPGREILAQPVPGDPIDCDLLVCDRVLPADYDAAFLLCFGVLPELYGRVGDIVEAEPNMQLREDFKDVGFEVPDLTLLNAREARTLLDGHALTPIVRHIAGGTLIGVRRDLLYCGYIPHESTLLQDSAGFLLLYRWLNSLQAAATQPFPPFVPWDRSVEFRIDEPGELQLTLVESAWLPAYGARSYSLMTGPDGRGEIGPFEIPGVYSVSRDGREIARVTAIWHDLPEQDLSVEARDPVDHYALLSRTHEPDWRDHLPGMLLWIALGLLVLEWVLWLAGVTE